MKEKERASDDKQRKLRQKILREKGKVFIYGKVHGTYNTRLIKISHVS